MHSLERSECMKRILVRSVYDAFEYVMDHYYPYGLEEFALHKDSYAVISIQDTHTQGFGFRFAESSTCKGVLTLYFDDIVKEVEGAVLFSEEMADQIFEFVRKHENAETLLIHCYGGLSRSLAVGTFLAGICGLKIQEGNINQYVYGVLEKQYQKYLKTL